MIEKVRLELSDWLYNAGIVGLVKILEYNDIDVRRNINYVEFNVSALDNFEEKYFNYLIDKYKPFTSWYKIISFEDIIDNFTLTEYSDQKLKIINDKIEDIKKYLKYPSYKSAYEIINDREFSLLKEEKKLSKISKKKEESISDINDKIQEQFEISIKIIEYLKKEEVRRVILTKNVIYDVIAKFWNGISFLGQGKNNNDMYIEYNNYFVEYVNDYVRQEKQNYKYRCFSCDRGITKLSKPDSYDLTWINSIGVDMSRKTSHFWEFNADAYICPVCNLVYSCIPAGFTVLKSRGLFINENSHVNALISINNMTLDHNKTLQELEEESYYSIAENMKQNNVEFIDKEIENIQIVKLDSNNGARPYIFNILSKEKLNLIYKYRRFLKYLINKSILVEKNYYINLYPEVLKRLYNNQNQFDLISKLFKLKMEGKFKNLFYLEQIIKINNGYLGGIMRAKYIGYKKINNYKDYGRKLRKLYKGKENKLGGITYRLLNALKTKDTSKFMDTLINSYLYLKASIPTDFVEALQNVDKFQTIGYAFVLGLQGGSNKPAIGENKNNEEGVSYE